LQFLRVGAMRFKAFALLGDHRFWRVFDEAAVAELAFRLSEFVIFPFELTD
jgi:hypothetical protein